MLDAKKTSNERRHVGADNGLIAPAEAAVRTSTLDLRTKQPGIRQGRGRGQPWAVAPERAIVPANSAQSVDSENQTLPSRTTRWASTTQITSYTTHIPNVDDRHGGLDSASDEEYFSTEEYLETDTKIAAQKGRGIIKSEAGVSNEISHGPVIQSDRFSVDRRPGVLDLRTLKVQHIASTTSDTLAAVAKGTSAENPKAISREKYGAHQMRGSESSNDKHDSFVSLAKETRRLNATARRTAQATLSATMPAADISYTSRHGAEVEGEKLDRDSVSSVSDLRNHPYLEIGKAASGLQASTTTMEQETTVATATLGKKTDRYDSLDPSSDDEYGDWDITAEEAAELEESALKKAQADRGIVMPAADISYMSSHGAAVQGKKLDSDSVLSVSDLRNHPYLEIGKAASGLQASTTTMEQETTVATATLGKKTDRYDSLDPSSDDEYGDWDITAEEAAELEESALKKAQADRGIAIPAGGILNLRKPQTVIYALPEMVNRPSTSPPQKTGTYGNREDERKRLGIGAAGDFEAEHNLPYNALHRGIPRKSSRGKALEKKMPAYLEVKEHHRNHPATGNTGKDRVEAGWPTGANCRTDMREMLFEPGAKAEGTSLSNIYQINQLGYAHVFAKSGLQSDNPLGATNQIRLATVSFNYTVKNNPAIELSGGAQNSETLRLDPKGQALAVLARETATTGRWPSRERMVEVYGHFLDQDNADVMQRTSTPPQTTQSGMNKAEKFNVTGEPSERRVNILSEDGHSERKRERSGISGR